MTFASEVMTTRFMTLRPDDTIADAVNRFQTASREQGKNVFGLMVTDDADRLVGMLSMYDILLFVQPRHAEIWQELVCSIICCGSTWSNRIRSEKIRQAPCRFAKASPAGQNSGMDDGQALTRTL
ncbi:MAG TPA: CBS domain-containing protein [Desulfosarcina sp.]|nr:CBS domain-containing protein [Desulfosarcina sp.]